MAFDQALAEEEPDVTLDIDDEPDEDIGLNENATEEDIGRYLLDDDPEERVARDAGIDGGGATAEEAAIHVVDDDTDPRPDGNTTGRSE